MPSKQTKPCTRHPWILTDGAGCPVCKSQPALTVVKRMDTRAPSSQRGYGTQHRRLRDDLIKRRPWCADPYGLHPNVKIPMRIRDHIVPLSQGGADNKTNEQPLCVSCHNYKIYRDGSRGRGG